MELETKKELQDNVTACGMYIHNAVSLTRILLDSENVLQKDMDNTLCILNEIVEKAVEEFEKLKKMTDRI